MRDELRKENNTSLTDTIVDVTEKAAAISTAAAFLYRNIGGKNVSSVINRMTHLNRSVIREFERTNYRDYNWRRLESMASNIKKSYTNPDLDDKLTFRSDSSDSFMEKVSHMYQFLKNPEGLSRRIYNDKYLVAPTLKHVDGLMNSIGATKVERSKANAFVRKLPYALGKKGNNVENIKDGLNIKGQNPAFDKALELATNYMLNQLNGKNTSYTAVRDSIKKIGDNISSRLFDVDKLLRLQNSKKSTFEKILNDQRVKVRDVLRNANRGKFSNTGSIGSYINSEGSPVFYGKLEALDEIREYILNEQGTEAFEKFLDIDIDKYLRIDGNNNIYSFNELANIQEKAINMAAGTLPGKLLKIRDIQYSQKASSLVYIGDGTIDPILSGTMGDGIQKVANTFLRIYDKTYMAKMDGSLEHIQSLDNTYMASSRYGGLGKQLRMMSGLAGERETDSWFRNTFDIAKTSKLTIFEKISNLFNSTESIDNNYMPNVIDTIINSRLTLDELYSQTRKVQAFMQKTTTAFTKDQLDILLRNEEDGDARQILEYLASDDKVSVLNLLASDDNTKPTFYNIGLSKTVNRYSRDMVSATQRINTYVETNPNYYSNKTFARDFEEDLNVELTKEYLLRKTFNDGDTSSNVYSKLKSVIENLDLPDSYNIKRTGYTAIEQFMSQTYGDQITNEDNVAKLTKASFISNLLKGDFTDEGRQEFKSIIEDTVNDASYKFDILRSNADNSTIDEYMNPYIHMRSFISPLDIIRDINNKTKSGKEATVSFLKQFIAGRDDMENVTLGTMFPYFMMSRLGDDLESTGLGFSNDSTKNVLSLIQTMGFKRLLPIAVAGTYYDYLDDIAQSVFGTGISATAVNGLANVDLFARKIADVTGIQSFIDNQFDLNPALQYWGGKDGFYTYDEEKDYYENGYDPVRKGRYWWFGSANEFRGSEIQYWQPNLVRRLNSDYYDKSMYDGFFDKWSHSLLPTPTNPISPLMYIADPYWLENKHYEDRPYAISGPMFERDTPWGAILNPTIGEIIKPEKEMHKDRMYSGVDVKVIASSLNDKIRSAAAEKGGYSAVFDSSDRLSIINNISYNAPTPSERLITVSGKDGATIIQGGGIYGDYKSDYNISIKHNVDFSKGEGYSDYSGSLASGSGNSNAISPLNIVAGLNNNIRINTVRGNSVSIPDKLAYTRSDIANAISNGDSVEDLINYSKGTDFVKEMAVSTRLITGIYGYGANRAFGFGEEDNKRIADSSDMDSFSRSFWDTSIGGLGGGVSEIFRRFIPEYRRNRRISPLMNDMPDWLPERYRFGDPYSSIPLGEARMPGKGYESLNELHPDQYGYYGAFDRYKILGDIAPYSKEFKIWKNIVKATVKDPMLVKEMEDIQSRVDEQSKTHDFYDYKFLGKDIEYQTVTVKNVYSNGSFTIVGSEDIYNLAGVDFKQELSMQSKDIMKQFINTGMEVTIAVDANDDTKRNNDYKNSINAAVFIDGESISQMLLDEQFVDKKKDDINSADIAALHNSFARLEGAALEFVTHIDIPLISDRWLRIRDPFESYKAEQLYGTPYQTWSDVIGTTLIPAMERSVSDNMYVNLSTLSFLGLNYLHDMEGIGKTNKMLLSGAMSLTNRGAFIGGAVSYALNANGSSFSKFQKIGAAAAFVGGLYTSANSDNILNSIISWGEAGLFVGDLMDPSKSDIKFNEGLMKKLLRSGESVEYRGKFGAAGAALGVIAYGLGGIIDGHDRPWVSDRIKEKWETEEYFDRLNYVKYMGLYNKAKELAKDEDGVDLDKIFAMRRHEQETIERIQKESDANASWYDRFKRNVKSTLESKPESDHRFEYDDGFSIEDLPGVHNGVFDSSSVSPEERMYTLNALASEGLKHRKHYSDNEERDMGQVNKFLDLHNTEQLKNYEVHHIVPYSLNGSDDPSNMIMLNKEDHAWITNAHRRFLFGEEANSFNSGDLLNGTQFANNEQTSINMSEHAREAIIFLQAAENTMYSVAERKASDWMDIIKALPKYERDYFNEFRKEKDQAKREEVLRFASPFQRRALQQVWGMETEDLESNEEYFEDNNLPDMFWDGWKQNVDLENVKAKVIHNEGQNFSDYGIYESVYRNPDVIDAPNLRRKESSNVLAVKLSLEANLHGLGLSEADVTVEPSSSSGIQAVINLVTVGTYNLKQAIQNVF